MIFQMLTKADPLRVHHLFESKDKVFGIATEEIVFGKLFREEGHPRGLSCSTTMTTMMMMRVMVITK